MFKTQISRYGIFPADAGVNLFHQQVLVLINYIPRGCRGEPISAAFFDSKIPYYPWVQEKLLYFFVKFGIILTENRE